MHINIDDLPSEKPHFTIPTPNTTLIIDNGTYKCKAGYKSSNPQLTFRNRIYKYKDIFTLENRPLSSPRSMFEKDIVISCEILEGTIDYVMNYLVNGRNEYTSDEQSESESGESDPDEVFRKRSKSSVKKIENVSKGGSKEDSKEGSKKGNKKDNKEGNKKDKNTNLVPEDIILTHVLGAPKFYQAQILSLLFEVYKFKRVQIGLDCFYSYLHNIKPEDRSITKQYIHNIDENDIDHIEKVKIERTQFTFPIPQSPPEPPREIDLVISLSHSNTLILAICDTKIIRHFKLPYGSNLASEYLLALIQSKYADISFKMGVKESMYALQNLKVGIEYGNAVMDVYGRMMEGVFENGIVSKTIKYNVEDENIMNMANVAKVKKVRVDDRKKSVVYDGNVSKETDINNDGIDLSKTINEMDIDEQFVGDISEPNVYDREDEFVDEFNSDMAGDGEHVKVQKLNTDSMTERQKIYYFIGKEDYELSKEGIKEKRKYRMIYYSTLYRFKQKVEKELKKIRINIEHLEEELEKNTDIDKYIEKIKERYDRVKKELKTRTRIKREVKNKRSKEFTILMKVSNGGTLNEEEEKVYKSIQEAGDEEMGVLVDGDFEKYRSILLQLDPAYLYEVNPVSIVRGDNIHLNGMSIDIELLKVAEVLFEPGLIGMQQPGLTEIFEELRGEKIRNVLLTGGFSRIQGLDKRVEHEINRTSVYGNVTVKWAEDCEGDAFRGAEFSKAFPVYTIDEFNEIGAEKMIEKYDLFC